jgi:hypothetical protein
MFWIDDTALTIECCTFTNNKSCFVFYTYFTNDIFVSDSTFTDNTSVILPYDYATEDSYFRNCTFNNNSIPDAGLFDDGVGHDFYSSKATFYDCDFGDSTFGVDNPNIVNTNAPNENQHGASIFGEGSLTMIISILAIIISAISICVTVVSNRKKTVPATANNVEEPDESKDSPQTC